MTTNDLSPLEHVTLDDVDVAYRRSGQGPRIVFIHGLGQDSKIWRQIQVAWSGHETIAYDLRGHGGTSVGQGEGTIAQMGHDLLSFLEFTGPAVCVGFSLGGSIALWAAAERPDLVIGVVAVATSSVVGRSAAESMDQRIDEVQAGDADTIRAIIEQDTRSQLAGADADFVAIVDDRILAIGDARGYLNGARAVRDMRENPLNPRLDVISQPVLVITGSLDPWCPRRAAEIMLEHLSDATFEELTGVGHLVTDVAASEFLAVAQPWVDQLEAS